MKIKKIICFNSKICIQGEIFNKTDKLTVLCFDETYISSRICFDKQNEQVLGPFICVQTVVARG